VAARPKKPPGRRELAGAGRREQILQAARGASTSDGHHQTHIKHVCEAAGVARSAVYLHYRLHSSPNHSRREVPVPASTIRTGSSGAVLPECADRLGAVLVELPGRSKVDLYLVRERLSQRQSGDHAPPPHNSRAMAEQSLYLGATGASATPSLR
jgi:hypothetical protein